MDSKVALLFIALIFIFSMKESKTQKGGSKAVVAGLGIAAAIGVGGIVYAVSSSSGDSKKKKDDGKTCAGAQCPSGKVMKQGVSDTVCSDQSDCTSKCCEDDSSDDPDDPDDPDANSTPNQVDAYIKYDSSSRTWGEDQPCSLFSIWKGSPGINALTDTSIKADDGMVICKASSADENGVCTGSCVDECSNYYGRFSDSDDKLYVCGAKARSDQKCVVTPNEDFRVYTDSNCSGP